MIKSYKLISSREPTARVSDYPRTVDNPPPAAVGLRQFFPPRPSQHRFSRGASVRRRATGGIRSNIPPRGTRRQQNRTMD